MSLPDFPSFNTNPWFCSHKERERERGQLKILDRNIPNLIVARENRNALTCQGVCLSDDLLFPVMKKNVIPNDKGSVWLAKFNSKSQFDSSSNSKEQEIRIDCFLPVSEEERALSSGKERNKKIRGRESKRGEKVCRLACI